MLFGDKFNYYLPQVMTDSGISQVQEHGSPYHDSDQYSVLHTFFDCIRWAGIRDLRCILAI